jgi:hypothetical protein
LPISDSEVGSFFTGVHLRSELSEPEVTETKKDKTPPPQPMETDASTGQTGEISGSAKTAILVDLEDEDSTNAEKVVETGRDRYC